MRDACYLAALDLHGSIAQFRTAQDINHSDIVNHELGRTAPELRYFIKCEG